MAVLTLTSTCSSPGVTTLAVGLALAWPRPVLLVDADPGAHQSVLAGYLAGRSPQGKGLLRVAEAHRDGRPLREVVIDQTIALTADIEHSRLFLPGFSKPGSASIFGGVWPDLAETLALLDEAGMDVIVDAGRVGTAGLPPALCEQTAMTCLVLGSNLRSVMSARVHAPALREQSELTAGEQPLGLVVVGEGEPYDRHEISKALEIPVMATFPRDPLTAMHFSDGRPRTKKFDTAPLTKSLHTSAASIQAGMHRASERVRS